MMSSRGLMVAIVVAVCVFLVFPQPDEARDSGWPVVGAFAGGLVAGVLVARPWYPGPVYTYPPPVVVYRVLPPVYFPNQAYASPDSGLSSGDEWVDVPGQYMDGSWVPPHSVWVPRRP